MKKGRNHKNMKRILFLVVLLLTFGFSIPSMVLFTEATSEDSLGVSSYAYEEVWSEDFNDGNYDGWGTMGIDITGEGVLVSTPNWSVNDGVLCAGEGPHFNIANHTSTIVYGKWEFDFYVVVGPWHHSAVYITKEGWELQEGVENGYAIAFAQSSYSVSEPGIHIAKSSGYHSTWHEFWLTPVNNTWFHVEVTHRENGTFNVYINGTLRIEWVDDSLPDSTHFELALEPGCRVDNIVVSRFVEDTTTTTTETDTTTDVTQPPDYTFLIIAVAGVAVLVIVIMIFMKLRK
jgi:hypothetical protein